MSVKELNGIFSKCSAELTYFWKFIDIIVFKQREGVRLKILLTGSNGMLGSDIVGVIGDRHECIPTTRETLDITKTTQIEKKLDETHPDWVIHLAALTDLDYCEKHPDETMHINAGSTGEIAKLCDDRGISMLYQSTSGVFSGKKATPYVETDEPDPITVYGRSKFEGEQAVIANMNSNRYLILRTSWLFGGGVEDKKFVAMMYRLLRERDKVKAVDDTYGSPNYTKDLGEMMLYLIENGGHGIFNTVNTGIATRYDITSKIKEYAGLDVEIERASQSDFISDAQRPSMEGLFNHRLEDEFSYTPQQWEIPMREYVKRLDEIYGK